MNLALLTDLYQFTMMQGFYLAGKDKETTVFDRTYRTNPCQGGYSLAVGLEHVIDYVQNLRFDADDIAYLKDLKIFRADFLDYLRSFSFTGDLWAVPEGTVVFPNEPILRVKAGRNECLLLETALSMFLNHESLIATRASRIKWAAKDDFLMEFGLRRAQGKDASLYGARAAYIGGFDATSNVLAGKMFGIPVVGTMAHSWVMSFDAEINAFRQYAEHYPDNLLVLVDTYDTLKSGVPNAIRLFKELLANGKLKEGSRYGIRLDSGDLAYLSKAAREMFDNAGLHEATISASNDLDETIISELKIQGAKIDAWGVGTRLITSEGCSSFGGVYKLAAEVQTAGIIPKLKRSDNVEKITNPGIKKIFRVYDAKSGKITTDLVMLEEEKFLPKGDLVLEDKDHPWRRKTLLKGTYKVRELLFPVFLGGRCIYQKPTLANVKNYAAKELASLWEESRRLLNAQIMKVNLSDSLYALRKELLLSAENHREGTETGGGAHYL
ncbi:MAG: nicotinate phosphoribosyltransferase, partial [Sporomusaceae bacterium]|nr:nicotinate phosphoribosyltransferase [Sporomusaceae bacterium]